MSAAIAPDFDVQALPAAEDRYFSSEPNLVAVFDYDYDAIVSFQKELQWAQLLSVPCAWVSVLCLTPCFINKNIEWHYMAQHVALTADGIKYVAERHPSGCGLSCQDVGKESRTVPYDKITDCDVTEPAGTAFCCCIPNVLSTVRVDTASSGGGSPEMALLGLKHPHHFKQTVWAMKRGQGPVASAPGSQPGAALLGKPAQADMNTGLLTEIRDELRQLNSIMREKQEPQRE